MYISVQGVVCIYHMTDEGGFFGGCGGGSTCSWFSNDSS